MGQRSCGRVAPWSQVAGTALAGSWERPMEGASPLLRGILTWNVWFEPFAFAARAAATFATIAARRPAVVALQEVTPAFLGALLREEWATQRYAFSSTDTSEGDWLVNTDEGGVCPYGCVLLVDKSLHPTFRVVPLVSDMERSLIVAHLLLPGGAVLSVSTVHLESQGTQPTRRRQLRTIARELAATPVVATAAAAAGVGGGPRTAPPAILVGDFNFDSRRNWSAHYTCADDGVAAAAAPEALDTGNREHGGGRTPPALSVALGGCFVEELDNDSLSEILREWVDLWPALHPPPAGGPGFTFDSTLNSNAALGVGRGGPPTYEQMRYDRIMVSPGLLSDAGVTIELVGLEKDHAAECEPSDHFGLFADMELGSLDFAAAQQLSTPPSSPGASGESSSPDAWSPTQLDLSPGGEHEQGLDEHGSMSALMTQPPTNSTPT